MCRIHNSIGSLTTIKNHLYRNNIHGFKSLKEVIDFRKSYSLYRKRIINHHKELIEQEKNTLQLDLQHLEIELEIRRLQAITEVNAEINELRQHLNSLEESHTTNYIHKITKSFKQDYYNQKIKQLETNRDLRVEISIKHLEDLNKQKSDRYQYLNSHFDDAVNQSGNHQLMKLDRLKVKIDEIRPFILGALGEQKVVKVLKGLSDEYSLINDFSISFSKPIYYKPENSYIKSVQIDHMLIAPSGIILIETKNWSEKSIENLNMRSPVQQIRRTSFVLFRMLNNGIANYHLNLDNHHWGKKNIPIKNVIVMTNSKPSEAFQFVKVLTLKELLNYISYFKPTFSNYETEKITDYLLSINSQNLISINRN